MKSYYVLKESLKDVILKGLHGAGSASRCDIEEGTIFEAIIPNASEGEKYSLMSLFYGGRAVIPSESLILIPAEFLDVRENVIKLVTDNRDDYTKIDNRGSRITFIRNTTAFKLFLQKDVGSRKIKSEYYNVVSKLFKYIPVSYCGVIGFEKNGYIIFKNSEGGTGHYNTNGVFKNSDIVNFIDLKAIERQCKFKVISYIDSAKMFKFTDLKKSMINNTYTGTELLLETTVKSINEKQNTIKLILEDGKKTRFLLSDLEIIYPNINSFNAPKDREIKEGIKVKLSNNKNINIPKNSLVSVVKIKEIGKGRGQKKYAIIDYNGQQSYVKVKNLKVC